MNTAKSVKGEFNTVIPNDVINFAAEVKRLCDVHKIIHFNAAFKTKEWPDVLQLQSNVDNTEIKLSTTAPLNISFTSKGVKNEHGR